MVLGLLKGVLEIIGWWDWRAPQWLLPAMIAMMLFFTFCGLNPLELRLYRWHWVLLLFQVLTSLVIFYVLRLFDLVLAQGVMLCVLMPSAVAAPVIAAKLGGSIRTLTAFTLLSSVATAFIVPVVFPLMTSMDTPFADTFFTILKRISPMLVAPFLAACMLRFLWNTWQHMRKTACRRNFREYSPHPFVLPRFFAELPFYLWAGTLTILMAQMTRELALYNGSLLVLFLLFAGAFITCLMQFLFGKYVGMRLPSPPGDEISVKETRVSAGQGLGQKNTTLGIWMAATWLSPVSALAPAAYIFWQNIFNAWQLARVAKGKTV